MSDQLAMCTLPPGSPVLGPAPGFDGADGNAVALCWPFLGLGVGVWLLETCSWSWLQLHHPRGKATDSGVMPCRSGLALPGSISMGWDTKSLNVIKLLSGSQNFILHNPFHLLRTPAHAGWSNSQAQHLIHGDYGHITEIRVNIQFAEDQSVSLSWNSFQLPHWQLC